MQVYVSALIVSVVMAYLYRTYNGFNEKKVLEDTSIYVRQKTRRRSRVTAFFIAFLSMVPLTFVSAVRVGVGTDYYTAYTYSYYYNKAYDTGYFKAEPLYNLIEEALKVVDAKDIWIFVVSASITGIIYYFGFFKFSVNPEYSICMYFLSNIYFISLNAVRQGIAMAILFLAIYVLSEDKNRLFVFMVLAAMGFHRSAIILIILYFLSKLEISISRSFVIMVMFIIGGGILGRIVQYVVNLTVYAAYYGSLFDSKEFDFANAAIQLSVLIAYSFYLGNSKFTEYAKLFRICYWMQIIAVIFIFSSATIPLAKRICWYMTINQLYAFPIISKIEESRMVKFFFNILVIVLFFVSIYIGIVRNGAHNVLPYRSIWSLL